MAKSQNYMLTRPHQMFQKVVDSPEVGLGPVPRMAMGNFGARTLPHGECTKYITLCENKNGVLWNSA